MIFTIIGLVFDIFGVIILFRFGILPDNLFDKIVTHQLHKKEVRKNTIWSKIGLSCLIIGFLLQIIGAL